MKIKIPILTLLIFGAVCLGAQDFQYSYWQFSPISYNPAFTGAFYGNLRLNGLVRDQWRTVPSSGKEYQTLSLSFDGNIPFGFKEGDWISAGMNMAKDRAGLSGFQTTFQGLSLAYHMTLGKENNAVITLGGKYGNYAKGLTSKDLSDAIKITEDRQSNDISELNIDDRPSSSDLMLGLMLYTPMGKTSDLRLGVAVDHVLAPQISQDTLVGGGIHREKINRRINFHAQYYVDLTDKVTLNPTILYQKMGSASNILVQGLISYAFNKEKEIYLNAGTGVRVSGNSFVPVYLGADIKDWKFGLSYSINVGGLSGVAREGGIELAASKIISWEKKARVNPIFICPRL